MNRIRPYTLLAMLASIAAPTSVVRCEPQPLSVVVEERKLDPRPPRQRSTRRRHNRKKRGW